MSISDDQRIAAAKAYVDALVSHDPSDVAITDDCVRIELGVKTGRNGGHIVRGLAKAPQFKLIHAITDFTATVEGDTVRTSFRVHVHPVTLRLSSVVTEKFVVNDDGKIAHIEAHFSVPRRDR